MYKKLMVVAGWLFSSVSLAATQTWDFNSGSLNFEGYNNTFNVNSGGVGLAITGWSDTEGNGDDVLAQGRLRYSSHYGLMLQNTDEQHTTPGHSIDNYGAAGEGNGNDYDAVLLTFDTAVSLEGFGIGWACENASHDTGGCNSSLAQADISVAAYTGAGSFSIGSSDTWSDVVAKGWSGVGGYGDVDSYSYQAVSTNIYSKYWLISAYNPLFAAAAETTGIRGIAAGDGFKLASIQGTTFTPPSTVPEPAGLALLLGGLLGLGLRDRRGA